MLVPNSKTSLSLALCLHLFSTTVLSIQNNTDAVNDCKWGPCRPLKSIKVCGIKRYNYTSAACLARGLGDTSGISYYCCLNVPESKDVVPTRFGHETQIAGKDEHPKNIQVSSKLPLCKEAKQQSFPFQASLIGQKPGSNSPNHFCSGTIYDSQHVLTAAHCMYDPDTNEAWRAENILVAAGERHLNRWERSEKIMRVEKIIIHRRYKLKALTQRFDIALLKLSEPLSFEDGTVTALPLPPSGYDSRKLKSGTVVGWSHIDINAKIGSPPLSKVDIPIVPDRQCAIRYRQGVEPQGEEKVDIDSQICTVSDATHRDCRGDSGGPLVCRISWRKHICGVASASSETTDLPNLYTDVTYYRDWIEQNTL